MYFRDPILYVRHDIHLRRGEARRSGTTTFSLGAAVIFINTKIEHIWCLINFEIMKKVDILLLLFVVSAQQYENLN